MIAILAWILIIGSLIKVFCLPFIFGQKRKEEIYSTKSWMYALIDAAIIIPVALAALHWVG